MIGNSMQTMLITGINGFLGSNLAKAFSNEYNIIGLEYGLENLQRIKDCNYKIYDVRHGIPNTLFTEQHIDIIIHAATFYGRENESVKTLATANLFIPFELLDQAINHQCSLFINTDTVLDRFVNTYALTKRHFQEWLYLRKNEIKIINMQLEHFYGPGASPSNFITTMIDRLKDNEPQIDLTFGEQLRDFIYIDDVISAYKQILFSNFKIIDKYSSFQVCTGELWTIKNLVLRIKNLTNSTSELRFGKIPYRKDELMKSKSDNSKLRMLGWQCEVLLSDGINKLLESINK